MRERPKEDSEVVSSAYNSEEIKILEELGDWLKIQKRIILEQKRLKTFRVKAFGFPGQKPDRAGRSEFAVNLGVSTTHALVAQIYVLLLTGISSFPFRVSCTSSHPSCLLN